MEPDFAIGTHDLDVLLANLPGEIQKESADLMALQFATAAADTKMNTIKTRAEADVAAAVGADGKKKFGNETERKAEVARICKADPLYTESEEICDTNAEPIKVAEIHIEYLRNTLRSARLLFAAANHITNE